LACPRPSNTRYVPAEDGRDVIERTINILRRINSALTTEAYRSGKGPDYGENLVRIVHELADLLLVEAIYPECSPGVGIPEERQTKSALYTGPAKHLSKPQDVGMFYDSLECLSSLMCHDNFNGVGPMLQLYITADVLAALTEAAFNPARDAVRRSRDELRLSSFVQG